MAAFEYDIFSVVAQTSSAVAYATDDCIGGLLSIGDVDNAKGVDGIIKQISIIDKFNQQAKYELTLFTEHPNNASFTNNAHFTINRGDIDKILPGTPVTVSTAAAQADGCIGNLATDIPFRLRKGTQIYGALSPQSAVTFNSVSGVLVKLGLIQNK
jgi:hypothetical protein